jgi:hypothetical protein
MGARAPASPRSGRRSASAGGKAWTTPAAARRKFCWLGDASWPGDYIKPPTPGTLPSQAWIYGDIDYANWGVNTGNLAPINGDGWPDGLTAMYPGGLQSAYNGPGGAVLIRPGSPGGTVGIDGTLYNLNYTGSWGPTGPNDRVYWLAGLLCDTLGGVDSSNLNTGTRWDPAFGGLHIFTGFASGAAYSAGAFPKAFARYILGARKPTLSIVQAWFAASTDTNEGTAAAMGPIGAGGVTDSSDFYIGKGLLGPTILTASVKLGGICINRMTTSDRDAPKANDGPYTRADPSYPLAHGHNAMESPSDRSSWRATSVELSPMATAAIVTAQAGRLSIAPRPRRTDPNETSHALLNG